MIRVLTGVALVAGLSVSALAQTPVYTFELRLIADGDAGAPSGPWAMYPRSDSASRIGFWLQARVSQTGGENFGIVRASSPVLPGSSTITISAAGSATLARGTIDAAETQYGRGAGFRFSNGSRPEWNTPTGNASDAAAYPSALHNDNGAFDQSQTRIYGFDAYIGATRNANEGDPNPWGAPLAGTGVFSPWQNLFRFTIENNVTNPTVAVLNASALLNGSLGTTTVGTNWVMRMGSGQVVSTSYELSLVPTPTAGVIPALAGVFVSRRRRAA